MGSVVNATSRPLYHRERAPVPTAKDTWWGPGRSRRGSNSEQSKLMPVAIRTMILRTAMRKYRLHKKYLYQQISILMLSLFNLLKPTGYVMYQQFNIQQLYALPTLCIYVFCIYLRTNSDLCHLQHKLIGFYNRDEKCLQRGTDWVFK